ncbi:hypothetical protein ACLGIH_28745 [Streptomyces sp. HMX87]|uniref:hypothetical protein n=1 Tax=Streptomyces sp. HMX87 TaxID=3390849 RepID=UPI003A88B5C9
MSSPADRYSPAVPVSAAACLGCRSSWGPEATAAPVVAAVSSSAAHSTAVVVRRFMAVLSAGGSG